MAEATDLLLVADDEADIHAVTKLTLKTLRRPGRKLEVLSASSGKETVAVLESRPEVAVVLLDVVMEANDAGLVACKTIRQELGNRFVRILLRTGQPGAAPEKQTIDEYDIDGYLPKAELTSNRLYSSVRAALKAHDEIVELDRHRRALARVSECALALKSFRPLPDLLRQVLDSAALIHPSPLGVLRLEALDQHGDMQRLVLQRASDGSTVDAQDALSKILREAAAGKLTSAGAVAGGWYMPLEVHRELGHGFLWCAGEPDALAQNALGMLAAHASNAVYSQIAQSILRAEQGPVFNSVDV